MTSDDYIIIGRDIGQAKFHLVGGNVLPAAPNPGGTPLDVVYIGKLIGEMSERTGENRKATAAEIELIRLCMRAESIPAGQLDEQKEEALLRNTKIEVMFESRTPGECIHEDKNTRIMVVPSDGTLKAGLDDLQMPVVGKPFEPPLTYPVDKNLMLSWLLDGIIELVVNVDSPEAPEAMNWHQIRKHFADSIEARLVEQASEDTVSQVAAFHRAVGIYVTNMCR